VPLADISFGELLLIALEIFFFVIWIWILITFLTDLNRDHPAQSTTGLGRGAEHWVYARAGQPCRNSTHIGTNACVTCGTR
jgi:hypothetical protein